MRRVAAATAVALAVVSAAWGQTAPTKPPRGGELSEPVPVIEEPAAPTRTPEEWQAIALENLNAMRDLLVTHTPILLPGGDAAQERWIEAGYQEALALIPRVRDELGLLYVLRWYALGFDDIHLDVRQDGPASVTRWPGFVAARRGQDTLITWRRDPPVGGQPPVGAVIRTCDGQTIEALIEGGLYRYWRSPGFSRGYLQTTTRLFIDNASGFFPPPQHCQMEWDGRERTVTLAWSEFTWGDRDFGEAYDEAHGGFGTPWGISRPAPGVLWVGAPSFMDDYTGGLPEPLVDIIDDFNRNRARYRRQGAIVIDLRGNHGGLRGGSSGLAEAVFGEEAVRRDRSMFMRTSSVVRITAENVEHLTGLRENYDQGPHPIGQEPTDNNIFDWMYLGALRNQRPSLTVGPLNERPTGGLTRQRVGAPPGPAADGARIYVLVNETCLSACLWFLDTVAFLPGVTLIGGVTGADGALTGPRTVDLPEPGMSLLLPMIEPRGSARGPGEAYEPDIAYPGVWRDEDVRAWVLDLIARGETANR